jgi:hypothetical protein
MSIKFLNLGQTINTVRPRGFKFPSGLTGAAGGPIILSFTASGSFIPPPGVDEVEYLVVAGGGGGGGQTVLVVALVVFLQVQDIQ